MCCGKICSAAHVKRAEGIHTEVAEDTLETANKDPDFPRKVITGDESWAYDYDPETKAHSSKWKSPRSSHLKKARQSQRNVKAMFMVFFDHEDVHHKYTPPGQTISKEYYIKILCRLRDAVRSKRP